MPEMVKPLSLMAHEFHLKIRILTCLYAGGTAVLDISLAQPCVKDENLNHSRCVICSPCRWFTGQPTRWFALWTSELKLNPHVGGKALTTGHNRTLPKTHLVVPFSRLSHEQELK